MIISDRMSGILRVAAIITLIIVLAVVIVVFVPQTTNSNTKSNNTVYFFYGAECSYCHEVMPFMNATIAKYPNIKFDVREIWHNETNNKLAVTMNNELNVSVGGWGVPEVIIGDVVMVGSKDIPEKLEGLLNNMSTGVKNA